MTELLEGLRVGMPVELFCYTLQEAERTPLARTALETGVLLAARD